jgi:integrase
VAGELFDNAGNRKYLIAEQRQAVLRAADKAPREVRTFCHLLHHSGCRISEALELTYDRVDLAAGVVVFESLKKRRSGVYRAVPVPPSFLDALDLAHGVWEKQRARGTGKNMRVWPWGRRRRASPAACGKGNIEELEVSVEPSSPSR